MRPNFLLFQVSCCSTIFPYYNTTELEVALGLFLQAGAEAGSSLTAQTTYQYDLVMLTLQVMSNYGLELHNTSWLAYNQSDRAVFASTSGLFLDMLQDLDELVGSQAQFLLGSWIQNATSLGNSMSSISMDSACHDYGLPRHHLQSRGDVCILPWARELRVTGHHDR